METVEQPFTGQNEKRSTERKHSKFNKLVTADLKFQQEEQEISYQENIFLVDLSLGGMRITAPQDWNIEEIFRLTIPLQSLSAHYPENLEVDCQIRWRKESGGDTFVYGLQFIDPSEADTEVLQTILASLDEEGGRQHFRLSCVLAVDVDLGTGQHLPMTMRDVSLGGFKIRHKLELPSEESFSIVLNLDRYKLECLARVRWEKSLDLGVKEFGCSFEDLDFEQLSRLSRFIVDKAC